jgi:phage baseplate assembly protein W
MTNNTRNFKDISFLFNKHPTTHDVTSKLNEASIIQSLKNLLLTKNFERPFHPEIGCQIHSLLFETNWDPILELIMRQTIIDVINKFEPRIFLTDVNIVPAPDLNSITIDIFYRLINSDRPSRFTTLLQRVR